ncbi:hypothetical protein [Geodermatophilus sp. SYSU D00698]
MATAWPANPQAPGALEGAVVEAWTSWKARKPVWTGAGAELLTGPLPPGVACVGFWWD